ncbi:Fur family transcriptional regulator [Rhabdothermincola salaria]|uniref:Fur family transcriptional regulator n=1 Tax=Rhabdothermincola salaria TaxID=2903142 RepID=UPI001E2A22AC|nr:Fur family transcriptional regulator [Rhabdothermincola salaria]MCD9622423.1 transcriptional repressor [Rhabdothermincola salaria]
MKTPDQLTDLFRAHGLRVTPQRQSVFRALHGNHGHPTAEAVHALVVQEMPTVSLRTVYATLHDLAAMGEIGELELGTGSARFDPNTSLHHHLVCDRCGKVHDVEATFASVRLPDDLEGGFEVSGTEIVFRGRCGPCRAAKDVQHPGPSPDPAARLSPAGSQTPSGDAPHG